MVREVYISGLIINVCFIFFQPISSSSGLMINLSEVSLVK